MNRYETFPPILAAVALAALQASAASPDGELTVSVVEAGTDQPLPARMHLRDSRGRPVRKRGLGLAPHGDHFYFDGKIVLGLRRGQYTFNLDAGWERRTRSGHFEIQRRSEGTERLEAARSCDLAKEGWFGADIDVDRALAHLAVAARAEQLAYLPLTSSRADRGTWRQSSRAAKARSEPPPGIGLHAARVDADGAALLFCRHAQAIDPSELPPGDGLTLDAISAAQDNGYRVVASDLTSWRLPILLAGGVLDAVAIIDRTSLLSSVAGKRLGRPADKRRFPGPQGPGRWRESIYFHLLNTGHRVPAVAGSGSGDTESPLGTNRVYAHCPDGFSIAQWWEAVADGRTMVTNGPLLRSTVYGEAPGFVFPLDDRGQFSASVGVNLSTRYPIEYLELIQNGEVATTVHLKELAEAGGKLPELEFDAGGWFAVRAATNDRDRYQFALTGPYYVERPGKPRISRASCQFFLDWLDEYAKRRIPAGWRTEEIADARAYWQTRQSQATAP